MEHRKPGAYAVDFQRQSGGINIGELNTAGLHSAFTHRVFTPLEKLLLIPCANHACDRSLSTYFVADGEQRSHSLVSQHIELLIHQVL
jgi:hypothetical protein